MTQRLAARGAASLALVTASLFSCPLLPVLYAQTPANGTPKTEAPKQSSSQGPAEYERWRSTSIDRSYKLKYVQSPQDQNEILTAIRNMVDPATKIFMVPSTSMIVARAPEDVQVSITKLLTALDLPHSHYRLTYTVTEFDGTRKIGVQHFSMSVVSGQRFQMKEGSRLPISTGGGNIAQFTYLDVGMNFDVTLSEVQGGGMLKSKVEQTSIAPDSITPGNPNPILRQTQLEGTSSLAIGKPLTLGSLDVPASTHHFEVEVLMEAAS